MENHSKNIVFWAAIFAHNAHAKRNQKRKYTGENYIVHPLAVAQIVGEVTPDLEMIAAAILHDTLEDTDTTKEELQEQFGARVASLVEEVTDVSKPSDGNRTIRKELDRQHLAKVSPDAKTIKLADLIDNTKSIVQYDPSFAKVYLKEKKALLEVLKEGNQELWNRANAQVEEKTDVAIKTKTKGGKI
jgi:(p)ppGpp synthase/HD superfamily hydrolase